MNFSNSNKSRRSRANRREDGSGKGRSGRSLRHRNRQLHLPLRHGVGTRMGRRQRAGMEQLRKQPRPPLPRMPLEIIDIPEAPKGVPPRGFALLYELAPSPTAPAVYLGQTARPARARFYSHRYQARYNTGRNNRLEAWIRRRAFAGHPVFIRIRSVHPIGEVSDAERAAIAALRADPRHDLRNIGPGGERAPVGSLVSEEARQRAAAMRRLRQRTTAARAHQSRVCCRRRHLPSAYDALLADFLATGPDTTAAELCRRHGISDGGLGALLHGRANTLVVNPDLLARARELWGQRMAQRQAATDRVEDLLRAFLQAPVGTALTELALEQGIDAKPIHQRLTRDAYGLPQDLVRRVRVRMRENRSEWARFRARPGVDRKQLRWWLTAYSRPGSQLTIAGIAAELKVTQSAISKITSEDGKWPACRKPISWRLRAACKARAGAASRAALNRSRDLASQAERRDGR